jgi:hypothetical protein
MRDGFEQWRCALRVSPKDFPKDFGDIKRLIETRLMPLVEREGAEQMIWSAYTFYPLFPPMDEVTAIRGEGIAPKLNG